MSGGTWVALDGTDPDVFTPVTAWVSDVGAYTGPATLPELDPALVPVDAAQVTYLVVPPNPDTHDDHVLGTGGYAYTVTDRLRQDYTPAGVTVTGVPTTHDAGSHLFVVWFPLTPAATTADLPAMVLSPFDLSPAGWVSGGLLGAGGSDTPETGSSGGGVPADPEPVTFTLHDVDGSLIGALTNVAGGTWQHELSKPGALSCKVRDDDPHFAALTPKRIVKVWWRGAPRMAARIDSSAVDLAVDGDRWREFNQLPGALNMLADGIVYPEYGKSRSSSAQRWFGYMSKGLPLDSGNFTAAEGYDYNDDVTNKAGKPEGLAFPNPWWIAKRGPTNIETGGLEEIFRKTFTISGTISYQILATADDFLSLWLDGELLYESDQRTAREWTTLQQITGTITAGPHLLAAKVINARGYVDNPMALIMTLQRLQVNGDVVAEAPIVNTDASWRVADNGPGYRRGDVLATIFDEARARSVPAFTTLSRGFTHTQDSNGADWTDAPGEYALDVMSTVLDAVEVLTETAIDVDVDFDTLTLQVFNRRGTDRSGSVTLASHVDGGSAKVLRVERVEAKFNTALVQKSDGTYVEEADATSVAAHGRIETGLQLGSTSETGTAAGVASAAFVENAATAYTFTVSVSTSTGPQPYTDFDIGDSVTLIDDLGGSRKVRVLSITVDASADRPEASVEVTVDRS